MSDILTLLCGKNCPVFGFVGLLGKGLFFGSFKIDVEL